MTAFPKVAFLGPLGTYSHQACLELCGHDVQLVPQPTITAAYEAISEDIPYALLPAENSTHGYVVDTYDILRLPDVGDRVRVHGETTLPIEHCLVAPHGVARSDVRAVVSHEQALGQCAQFLREHLPNAERVKCPSTAEAALQVLKDAPDAGRAAICCGVVVELYSGLRILEANIQDQGDNFTRFLLLATRPWQTDRRPTRALMRVQPQPQGQGIVPLLSALELPTLKIDRRPSLLPKPFHDVYLIEAEADSEQEIDDAVERVRMLGAECALLGEW
ncbi:PDT-domain-containing protein [Auricularia subglabra TFB-10046 SS5]|nr:PDT-domain-containing protein [Auricularia subglabra TFB-10046 SS5]